MQPEQWVALLREVGILPAVLFFILWRMERVLRELRDVIIDLKTTVSHHIITHDG